MCVRNGEAARIWEVFCGLGVFCARVSPASLQTAQTMPKRAGNTRTGVAVGLGFGETCPRLASVRVSSTQAGGVRAGHTGGPASGHPGFNQHCLPSRWRRIARTVAAGRPTDKADCQAVSKTHISYAPAQDLSPSPLPSLECPLWRNARPKIWTAVSTLPRCRLLGGNAHVRLPLCAFSHSDVAYQQHIWARG